MVVKEFECERARTHWTGIIKIKEMTEHCCVAEVNARGTAFAVAITCYYEGYGMKEWCICVPSHNFGCKLSALSAEWNEEQFEPFIKNKVDRRSLTCAVEVLLLELLKPEIE